MWITDLGLLRVLMIHILLCVVRSAFLTWPGMWISNTGIAIG